MTRSPFQSVGDAEVARVEDLVLDTFGPETLFPDWNDADRPLLDAMPASLAPDRRHVRLSIHSWLVKRAGKTILIDTGAGNDKPRPYAPYFDALTTRYLANLRDLGVDRGDVDFVLHTHLHVDHVGWNMIREAGRWVPTFPNARHVFSAREFAYFTDAANLTDRNRTSFEVQRDSVAPIVDAGLADRIVVGGSEVVPGFTFHPTPGHSVDHASIALESAGAVALFPGDVLHHPVQVVRPTLSSVFDPERERTMRSREWALAFAADHDALWFSSHFADSGYGRVTRSGAGYGWRFATPSGDDR